MYGIDIFVIGVFIAGISAAINFYAQPIACVGCVWYQEPYYTISHITYGTTGMGAVIAVIGYIKNKREHIEW